LKNKKSNISNKNHDNNKQVVYTYDPFIKVYRENFKNKHLTRKNFHNIKIQDAAMVILENDRNEILFLNEYRRGLKKMSLGLPGGHIEKKEKPISTIKRELLEETGHYATSWKLLLRYTMHGTYELGKDYFFTAKLIEKTTNNKSENIQKKWINKKKLLNMLYNKKFESAGIIAAVSYYLILNSKLKI
jgi:8-oxo-dGTP pyrophosphatase MutT (NUDIX family)